MPDVVDGMLEDRDPVDSHSPGETGVTRVIDARHPQHFGMDHPGAQDFDPATLSSRK